MPNTQENAGIPAVKKLSKRNKIFHYIAQGDYGNRQELVTCLIVRFNLSKKSAENKIKEYLNCFATSEIKKRLTE